ncbi:MAG: hypothetical protein V2J12_03410 [Gammaproteobacteria bacterium]|jgi:hypothetical protein|nr:hypothetical protein [Gammaproteobacteria bacterium]
MATGIGENEQGLPEDAPRAWRRWSRRAQNIATIGWSSFLAACLATGLFFAQVDPRDIQLVVTSMRDISAEAGYAIGFFFFWFVCGVSSLLAVFLIRTSRRRNGRPRTSDHRTGN